MSRPARRTRRHLYVDVRIASNPDGPCSTRRSSTRATSRSVLRARPRTAPCGDPTIPLAVRSSCRPTSIGATLEIDHVSASTRRTSHDEASCSFLAACLRASPCVALLIAGAPRRVPNCISTSRAARSSRCRSRSRTFAGNAAKSARSATTSRRWSRPISSARACSGRSTRAPSSRRIAAQSHAAALRRLAHHQRPGAGHRRRRDAARRAAARRVPPVGRARRAADDRAALHDDAAELAPHRPHHRRRDLQAHHRRGRLFRHAHRLHLGDRSRRPPHQAPRHHGPGRRQPPLPDRRPLAGADAALLADARRRSPISPMRATRRASISSTSTPASRKCSATFPGMTFAPRFSPDGNKVVMSLADRRQHATSTRSICAPARRRG